MGWVKPTCSAGCARCATALPNRCTQWMHHPSDPGPHLDRVVQAAEIWVRLDDAEHAVRALDVPGTRLGCGRERRPVGAVGPHVPSPGTVRRSTASGAVPGSTS